MRRRLLLCALVSLAGWSFIAVPANACSIAVPPDYDPIRDPFENSDIALTGRVTRVRRPKTGDGEPKPFSFEATIRISRVYKGKTGPALRIRGNTEESLCGYGEIRKGQRVALLLRGRRTPFAVDISNGTSYRNLEKVTGGRSHRPGRK